MKKSKESDTTILRSIPRLGIPITSIGLLLIGIGIAFGHGGEKHDSTKVDEEEPTVSLSSLESAAKDSIFVIIQTEFAALQPVFEKGCFNCHTTRTKFPWYYEFPFVKGMIDEDVTEAKKHLDMSNGFPFGGHGKPADDLVAIREQVEEGEMPPWNYRLMHWSAKPSQSESDSIVAWVERGLASLASIGVIPTEPDDDSESHEATSEGAAESGLAYVCPMHPEITSDHQENCSLCGMPLEVRASVDSSKADSDTGND